jgi:hypothetical protein
MPVVFRGELRLAFGGITTVLPATAARALGVRAHDSSALAEPNCQLIRGNLSEILDQKIRVDALCLPLESVIAGVGDCAILSVRTEISPKRSRALSTNGARQVVTLAKQRVAAKQIERLRRLVSALLRRARPRRRPLTDRTQSSHFYCRFHRIGNEADFVRLVMHVI